jgi:hypothetical protein
MEKGCSLHVESGISGPLRVYYRQGGWHSVLPARSEVRLPQGLRFTDVRRSNLGDFPLASRGSRIAKSRGRCELCPLSCLVRSLRLPSAASLFRAHLRNLLDGVSRSKRKPVRALRRRARRADSGWPFKLRTLPGLPAGAAAFCAGSGLRTLSGPHEGGHPRAEV